MTEGAGTAADFPVRLYSGGVLISSFEILSGARVAVEDGDRLDVSSGGVTERVSIASGVTQKVFAGGSAVSGSMVSGGLQILDGGKSFNTELYGFYSGGDADNWDQDHGKQWVYNGGTAVDSLIGSGGAQWVYAGGSAVGAVVKNNGRQMVGSGGSASGSLVEAGGFLSVYNGGRLNDIEVNAEGLLSVGSLLDGAVVAGKIYAWKAGVLRSVTMTGGGYAFLDSGCSAFDMEVFNASAVVELSTVNGMLLASGGRVALSNYSLAVDVKVGYRSELLVREDSCAVDVVVASGGTIRIAGGSAVNLTVESGGSASVSDGTVNGLTVGGSACVRGLIDYATVTSGGFLDARDAECWTVETYGQTALTNAGRVTLHIEKRLPEDDTLLWVDGIDGKIDEFGVVVSSGEQKNGVYKLMEIDPANQNCAKSITLKNDRGLEYAVLSNSNRYFEIGNVVYTFSGFDMNTVTLTVGTALGVRLYFHEELVDRRSSIADMKLYWWGDFDCAKISGNGTADRVVVGISGTMLVESGGFAGDTVVAAGGKMTVGAGGRVSGLTVTSGGFCTISQDAGTVFGVLSVWNGGKVSLGGAVDFSGIDFNLSMPVFSPEPRLDGLNNISAGCAITVKCDQRMLDGVYVLASGATGFDRSITVYDGGRLLGTVTLDTALVADIGTYSVSVSAEGVLALTKTYIPKAVRVYGDCDVLLEDADIFVGYDFKDHPAACRMVVGSGGVASGTVLNRYYNISQDVLSGGLAAATVVGIGVQRVSAGGVASGTRLLGGGCQRVYGVAVDTVLAGSAANQVVESGGYAGNTYCSGENSCYDVFQLVSSGGIADGTVLIGSRLWQDVGNGGVAWNTRLDRGAVQLIASGGGAMFTEIGSGSVQQVGGSSLYSIISSGGVQQVTYGGWSEEIQVRSGGRLNVVGGSALRVSAAEGATVGYGFGVMSEMISGGKLVEISSALSCDLVIASGNLRVEDGCSALRSIVSSGGGLQILSGGTAKDVTLYRSGLVSIADGGRVYGLRTEKNTFSGGEGIIDVGAGGSAAGIFAGDFIKLLVSGSVSDCDAAYYFEVSSGGTASDVRLSGSAAIIGTAAGIEAASARIEVYGRVDNVVMRGGRLSINSGGAGANIGIDNGARCIVSSGGALQGTVRIGRQGDLSIAGTMPVGDFSVIVDLSSAIGRTSMAIEASWLGAAPSISVEVGSGNATGGAALMSHWGWTYSGGVELVYNGRSMGTLEVNGTMAVENYEYSLIDNGNIIYFDVFGRFDRWVATENGEASNNTLHNVAVDRLYAFASTSVISNVSSLIYLKKCSTGNFYGGSVDGNIGGGVSITLAGGEVSGMIYGGSFAYGRTAIIKSSVNVVLSGCRQFDNPTQLLKGRYSAWLVGGGAAIGGYLAIYDDITVTVDEYSECVRVVGGAQASGENSLADVGGNVNITVNGLVRGNIYGGGYADRGGKSVVCGDVNITIGTSGSVQGNIYGGGATPGATGVSVVEGNSTITLCGSHINVGTVSGDSGFGTVNGVRRLVVKDCYGDFNVNIKNFDVIEFNNSSIESGCGYRSDAFKFVFTASQQQNVAFIDEASAFSFSDGNKLLQIDMNWRRHDQLLMAVDDGVDLSDLTIEIYDGASRYCSFNYGESVYGFTVEKVYGYLALKLV
ncbi:MAG: hypothetical protein PHI85_09735 [Victivallaceae bacterium]|nr:hypothetical protein [Victivallaceae bacterium]